MDKSDPTILALRELDTPGKYIVRRNVPVFVEHDDPKTGQKWNRTKLSKLAQNSNRRATENGTPTSIVIGHTPGRKEEELVHVGYARNYRVGTFGPKKKLGILADFYYKPDTYAKAKQYPHRSIELWTDDMIIDPVSLLARTPQLDLGLLLPDEGPVEKSLAVSDGCQLMVYTRGGNRRLYQMIEDSDMDLNAFLDGLQELINKARGGAGGDEPETYGAMPGGTNTAMPKLIQYSKEDFEKLQIERDEYKRKADEAQRLYQKTARQQALEKVKAEGVLLDVEAELADVADFDDAKFDAHLAKVKKCYARSAGGSAGFIPTEQPTSGDAETDYARLRPAVMEYAKKHKCDVNKAYQAVRAGKQ
ncbi:MAG TPA: hypothetical protein PLN21_09405 [Gemmatales bacterium]|nr:hypothetical protein [Gemmatales bacterium]